MNFAVKWNIIHLMDYIKIKIYMRGNNIHKEVITRITQA